MDLRVLVLTADRELGELVVAQVDNLGCSSILATTYDEGSTALGWADAAVIDLAGDGVEDLNRLRVEAPMVRILAIAPDTDREASARSAGAHLVLIEPFSVAEIVYAVRAMGHSGETGVIDLRADQHVAAPVVDDAPWWATR